jgi:hypothetical protein
MEDEQPAADREGAAEIVDVGERDERVRTEDQQEIPAGRARGRSQELEAARAGAAAEAGAAVVTAVRDDLLKDVVALRRIRIAGAA